MNDILERLGLERTNPGTWSGTRAAAGEDAPLIESVNPTTNEVIAAVRATTRAEYERTIEAARAASREWRKVPAPVRGEAARRIGNALRDHKGALGSLVTLENGKVSAYRAKVKVSFKYEGGA